MSTTLHIVTSIQELVEQDGFKDQRNTRLQRGLAFLKEFAETKDWRCFMATMCQYTITLQALQESIPNNKKAAKTQIANLFEQMKASVIKDIQVACLQKPRKTLGSVKTLLLSLHKCW